MNTINNLTKTLDEYYAKIPALPKGIKDFLAKIAPWLALIFGILAILSAINIFTGMTTLNKIAGYAVFAAMGSNLYIMLIVSAVVALLQGILEVMAFSPLKAGKAKGWNLLFYTLLLGLISAFVTLNISSIIGSIVETLIGYYFLYQIKTYYVKA
jgi:hypothetical protein